jgi:phosphate transport system protein
MARDLRLMAAILEVITELERMGDYAKGHCQGDICAWANPHAAQHARVSRMAEKAVRYAAPRAGRIY